MDAPASGAVRTRAPGPLSAFAVLMTVAVAAGFFLWAGAGDRPAPLVRAVESRAPREAGAPPSFEALRTWESLRARLDGAYRSPGGAAISEVVAPDSPIESELAAHLRFLERRSLSDRSVTRVLGVRLLSPSASEVMLIETALVHPRFVDEATGTRVDLDLEATRVRRRWILVTTEDGWRIYSVDVLAEEPS